MSENFKRAVTIIFILFGLLWACTPNTQLAPEELSRAKLEKIVTQNALKKANLAPKGFQDVYNLTGTYKAPSGAEVPFTITTFLAKSDVERLVNHPKVSLEVPQISTRAKLMEVLPSLGLGLVILGLMLYQMNMSKGRGTHKIRQRPTTRFADVAGVEEAKGEVQEVIDFLKNPGKYQQLGGSLPKGILLVGPPGTGKTMLAKAIAGEANANFFSASGSDFNEVYVGVGAKRIRELFNQARKHTPSIIFIDEIDCLGKNRKFDQNGELQQTNNALLTAMDGFDTSEGIIVVAATNRPEDLDEALLRPGRFDRKVNVPLPDSKGRRAILERHSLKTRIASHAEALATIAQTTPGMSGAELANVINEAAILSAQRKMEQITLCELEEARDKVRWGKERRSMCMAEGERRIVAYHEAGHAIISLHKKLLPPLHKVSIIPRGNSLGSTVSLPKEDQNIHGKKFLLEQLVVLMGGRAAENIFIGDMTNGANGDLDAAKNIARKMIHDWGMGQRLYYEPQKTDAEAEINSLLTNAYDEAHQTILKCKAQTGRLAEALLKGETLSREDVLQVIKVGTPAHPVVPSEGEFGPFIYN
jgi:cell division protease FtsH